MNLLNADLTGMRTGKKLVMLERPRLLVLDLLETYARERDIDVRLERRHERDQWICRLSGNGNGSVECLGGTARQAIMSALQQVGVEIPN
jgi:hypothetical protein